MVDVTIGQYYPEDSIIHRLDPRVKLFTTMVFIVLIFVANNLFSYLVLTLFLVSVIVASKVPFKKLMRGLRGIIFILMISVIFNIFATDGTVLVGIWKLTITKEGLIRGGYLAVRLIYLVVGTSIMTLTTKPTDLSDGLEKAFGFLNKINFPVHEIAMIMSLALRFIPTLMEELDKITKAQKARGADLDSGNLIQRVKSLIPILIPLFISSIRRALDLANAMEARCYRSGDRTKMKPLKYERRDHIGYAVNAALIAVLAVVNIVVSNTGALSMFMTNL